MYRSAISTEVRSSSLRQWKTDSEGDSEVLILPLSLVPRVPVQGVGGVGRVVSEAGLLVPAGPWYGLSCCLTSQASPQPLCYSAGGSSATQTKMAIPGRANFGNTCVVLSPPTHKVHGLRGMATST